MSFSLWETGKQMSEMSGVTDKFWPWSRKQNRSKANRVLPKEYTGRNKYGHHLKVNIEIRLIIFFAVEDGEGLYSQQKSD